MILVVPNPSVSSNPSNPSSVLTGWYDFPVKKALKRKPPEEIRCSQILLKHCDLKRPFDRHDHVITRTKVAPRTLCAWVAPVADIRVGEAKLVRIAWGW